MFQARSDTPLSELAELIHTCRNRLNRMSLLAGGVRPSDDEQRRRVRAIQETIQELSLLLAEVERAAAKEDCGKPPRRDSLAPHPR